MGTNYEHLTAEERATLMVTRADGCSQRAVARCLGRSPSTLAPKFRILKIYRAETRPENFGLRHETSDFLRQRPGSWPLSFGNVGTSVSTRNPWRETAVAGWA
jgi:Helix-turn-helix domain